MGWFGLGWDGMVWFGMGWFGMGWGNDMAHSCHAVCRITVIISYYDRVFARPRLDFDPFDIMTTHQRVELVNFRPRIGRQFNSRAQPRTEVITFGRSVQLFNKLDLVRFN